MKIQLLPNFFKKIGLLLYVVCGIPSMGKGWAAGGTPNCGDCVTTNPFPVSEEVYFYTSILSLIGIIIYALSKEKIEDEYTSLLRWESVITAFVFTVFIVLFSILKVGRDGIFAADLLVELQLLFFLIIFFFKKRTALA